MQALLKSAIGSSSARYEPTRRRAVVQRSVIAVVNDRPSHAAEHRLDHVKELGA
jgi:hypothetical protein